MEVQEDSGEGGEARRRGLGRKQCMRTGPSCGCRSSRELRAFCVGGVEVDEEHMGTETSTQESDQSTE